MKHRLPDAPRRAILLAPLVIALGVLPVGCAKHDGGHDTHASGGAAIERLALDAGRRWPTDEPLRAGMAAVHAAYEAERGAIDAGSASDAQYDALAGRIDAEVQDIVRNCRLPPAADANLHYIVADLMRGVHEMRGGDPARTRHDGAALVHGALDAYGSFFDDPAFGATAQVP
ncbi:MAG: hypothetical protein KIT37_04375 [Steroidobacteraceae bacterium]|nr:hypothetical protein [Steroidobacteraceae bacterium]